MARKQTRSPRAASGPKCVFISYRRGDTPALARLLRLELERQIGGDRVFLDREDIELGEDIVERIHEAISSAGVVLALIGPDWLESLNERLKSKGRGVCDYVRQELKQAFESSVPVLPILADGVAMPAARELPTDLRPLTRQNWLGVTKRHFDSEVERVVAAVRRYLDLPAAAGVRRSPREHQLLEAAGRGNATRIEALLREGVPVDARGSDGATPLMLAAGGGHSHAVRVLLKRGADVNAQDDRGGAALIAAVANRASPMVVKILLDHGAHVDSPTNDGSTALLYAADRGDPDTVRLLVDKGADPRMPNDAGVVALMRALYIQDEERKMEVLRLLRDSHHALEPERRADAGGDVDFVCRVVAEHFQVAPAAIDLNVPLGRQAVKADDLDLVDIISAIEDRTGVTLSLGDEGAVSPMVVSVQWLSERLAGSREG